MPEAQYLVPILNVSDFNASVAWFGKLGWHKNWDWCPPGSPTPTFGSVGSGHVEIFLCEGAQGGRGEHGAWMSIWVDDVDAVHAICLAQGIDVAMPPQDEPWGVREMHVRHPDGHTFRIGREIHTHEHEHEHGDHEHGHDHDHSGHGH